jgi:hypothetical protein
MKAKDRKWVTIVGLGVLALAVVVGVGAIVPGAASAQADTEAATTEGARSGQPTEPGRRGMAPDAGRGVGDEYLAEALGITVEELRAAHQTAFDRAVDRALEQGLITEEQAEQLKDRGSMRPGGGPGGRGGFGLRGADIDMDALLAEALGITVDELAAARDAAAEAALQARVADGSITEDEAAMIRARRALGDYLQEKGLAEQLRAVYEQAVAEAVAAGVITQEQADAILEEPGFGLGGHGFGGRGGHGPGGGPGMGGGRGMGDGAGAGGFFQGAPLPGTGDTALESAGADA